MREMGWGVEGEEVGQGVDGNGGVPESEDDCGRSVEEGRARAGASGGKEVVPSPDAGADELVVGVEGNLGVEGGAEVVERVTFLDGVEDRGREQGAQYPGSLGASPALGGGFEKGDDLGFGEGEVQAVELAPPLGVLHEGKKFLWSIGEEAEVVDEEQDGDVDVEARGGDGDVGKGGLEEPYEGRDADAPEEG